MYLTSDEFKILKAVKMGLTHKEISEQFGITLKLNDPRLSSLFKKYGVKDEGKGLKHALSQKADINKVEVVEFEKMPYFEYDDNYLVKKIKITKKDFLALEKFFKKVKDKNLEYELISHEDAFNMYKSLSIKDPLRNSKYNINLEIDGEDFTKSEKVVLIGIGGGGQNIVNYIQNQKHADFKILSINSDEQVLKTSKTKNILLCSNPNLFWHIKKIFNKKLHLGCGGDVEIAKSYALACKKTIKKEIKKADKIILVSCFGGGTGTGATPVVAKFANDSGIKVEAIIIHPFKFEGNKREKRAYEGVCELKKYSNNIIEIHNNELTTNSDGSLQNAFSDTNEKISKIIFEKLI